MMNNFIKVVPVVVAVFFLNVHICFALSLETAISLASQNLPSHKSLKINIDSKNFLYKASLSPYLPTLDLGGEVEWRDTADNKNSTIRDVTLRYSLNGEPVQTMPSSVLDLDSESVNRIDGDTYDINHYDVTLGYILFDGGVRKADRNIARLELDSAREAFKGDLIDLEHDVKVIYFNAVTKKEILAQREMQLKNAETVYEIAKGKYKHGSTLLSDVLQATVDLKKAMVETRHAKGDIAKAMFELNSFLGRDLQSPYDLDEKSNVNVTLPRREELIASALDKPIAREALNEVEKTKNIVSRNLGQFYPTVLSSLSYSYTDGFDEFWEDPVEITSAKVTAKFNIFEFKKYYDRKSYKKEVKVSRENLNSIKRELTLNLYNTYEDFLTFKESVQLATQRLKESQFNYDQAMGEYKAGKGDILALVRAHTLLSDAMNLLSKTNFGFSQAKAALEQAAGIKNLETLEKVN